MGAAVPSFCTWLCFGLCGCESTIKLGPKIALQVKPTEGVHLPPLESEAQVAVYTKTEIGERVRRAFGQVILPISALPAHNVVAELQVEAPSAFWWPDVMKSAQGAARRLSADAIV